MQILIEIAGYFVRFSIVGGLAVLLATWGVQYLHLRAERKNLNALLADIEAAQTEYKKFRDEVLSVSRYAEILNQIRAAKDRVKKSKSHFGGSVK